VVTGWPPVSAWLLVLFVAGVSAQVPEPSPTFSELAARAQQAAESERTADAISLYRQLVKQRPSWSEGWWRLGGLLFYSRQYAESRDAFRRFVAQEPKAGPGFAMVGLCEYELRRYPESLAALEKAIGLGLGPNPELNRNSLYRDAILLALLGQPDIALKRLTLMANQLAAAHPKAEARSLLTDTELVDAMGIVALRIPSLPQDIPPNKQDLVRKAGRAQTLVGLNDWVAAAQEFAELSATFNRDPGVHYMYGVFLLKERPAEAVAEFQKEIEIDPKNPDARLQIALECLRTGEFEAGLRSASEAVKLQPANFAAHIVASRLWLGAGDVPRAVEEAQAAVKLAPDSPDAHLALSRAYAQANRSEDADRERAEFRRLRGLNDRHEKQDPAAR
jgi:tetratricopeptide (TPR) repeat protein